MTVTILGRSDGIKPVTRSGAKVGDAIYVTGPLGGSLSGRHMNFTPRIKPARVLAREFRVHSMIDISDGLSRDLRHICEQSGVGAVIDAAAIPVHEDAIEARRDGRAPIEHALHDGEDHELLFTMPGPNKRVGVKLMADGCELIWIGHITKEQQIMLEVKGEQKPLEARGWEHRL